MSQWVAGGLTFFVLGQVTLDHGAFHPVAALPGAGDFGIVSERNVELLAVLRAVTRNPGAAPSRGCGRSRNLRLQGDCLLGHDQPLVSTPLNLFLFLTLLST